MSSDDAEGEVVPPVAMQKVPFAAPALSTSALTSAAAAEGVPYVCVQKGPVGSDDGSTTSPSSKVANLVANLVQ